MRCKAFPNDKVPKALDLADAKVGDLVTLESEEVELTERQTKELRRALKSILGRSVASAELHLEAEPPTARCLVVHTRHAGAAIELMHSGQLAGLLGEVVE